MSQKRCHLMSQFVTDSICSHVHWEKNALTDLYWGVWAWGQEKCLLVPVVWTGTSCGKKDVCPCSWAHVVGVLCCGGVCLMRLGAVQGVEHRSGPEHTVSNLRILCMAYPSFFFFSRIFTHFIKEMATHSSVLAWRIPGTGEPGGLPFTGSHRVGHNWSNLAAAAAATTSLAISKNAQHT